MTLVPKAGPINEGRDSHDAWTTWKTAMEAAGGVMTETDAVAMIRAELRAEKVRAISRFLDR